MFIIQPLYSRCVSTGAASVNPKPDLGIERITVMKGWVRAMKANGGDFPMLYLRSCPRCKGDMHSNRDMYGAYKECLQCGHMVDLKQPDGLVAVAAQQPRSKKKAA